MRGARRIAWRARRLSCRRIEAWYGRRFPGSAARTRVNRGRRWYDHRCGKTPLRYDSPMRQDGSGSNYRSTHGLVTRAQLRRRGASRFPFFLSLGSGKPRCHACPGREGDPDRSAPAGAAEPVARSRYQCRWRHTLSSRTRTVANGKVPMLIRLFRRRRARSGRRPPPRPPALGRHPCSHRGRRVRRSRAEQARAGGGGAHPPPPAHRPVLSTSSRQQWMSRNQGVFDCGGRSSTCCFARTATWGARACFVLARSRRRAAPDEGSTDKPPA